MSKFIIYGVLTTAAVTGTTLTTLAQVEMGIGKAFGANHAYQFTAPRGWIADDKAAEDQGIPVVFYPKGSSWSKSTAVMYTRPIGRNDQIKTAQDVVNNTVQDFHSDGSPGYKATFKQNLSLGNGQVAKIYFFEGDRYGNSEAAAYIEEAQTINFIVFNARNKEAFKANLSAFMAIVKSYKNTYPGRS
jgi:hypothetical protein